MKFEYSYFTDGKTHFRPSVLSALGDSFEPLFETNGNQHNAEPFTSVPQMKVNTRTVMDANVASEITIGVCAFVGGWGGGKILDELYDSYLKPGFLNVVDKLKNEHSLNTSVVVDLYSVTNFEDLNTAVVIRLTSTLELLDEDKNKLFKESLNSAKEYIDRNGVKSPVHYYHINNGAMNVEPMLKNSIEQIQLERTAP
ncbi:hypothetical protein [Vibrio parahaemolyticus]|uniref:hypothetical protein n=1 Tax=Vibrio parahaemolyticus TaxID=670 RepID=UPI0011235492|nr:hypothetical protein [Vibrio parahaemolyticus]TOZ82411.1 hypothetical protein DXJ95_24300 [Vibrio parahaemolyticus]